MTPTEPFLRLETIGKRYANAGEAAVDSISVDIRQGEFVSLLGPSGSGKTTTLMMVAGFELPTQGRILLTGRDIVGIPAHQRNFGMVFQNYALFPHMTVFENVAYPLRMRKVPKPHIEQSVGRYLDMVGLAAFATRRPSELSGGQQQRVALARALVFEPAVVLMDEPLGALDKNLREQLQVEIKDLQQKLGITLVYVTHDQSEAMTMSDRIAVFNRGRIEQIAPPSDIYQRPATRFVGEFVGESNMIETRVAEHGSRFADSSVGRIEHVAAVPFQAGQPVLAMIRPELIALADKPADSNSVAIKLTHLVHFGDRVMIEGNTTNGTSIKLRVTDREAAGLTAGAAVNVAWRPEDVHLLAR